MSGDPAEYAAIWFALLVEEIRETSDASTLRKIAARLKGLAKLAEDMAADAGPDLEPFIMQAETRRVQ